MYNNDCISIVFKCLPETKNTNRKCGVVDNDLERTCFTTRTCDCQVQATICPSISLPQELIKHTDVPDNLK